MFPDTVIDAATVRAYRETAYHVSLRPPVVLRIGLRSAPLARLHALNAATCSAFVTACNPFSRPMSEPQNLARQLELKAWLSERNRTCAEGFGKHPHNGWPAEQSLLVFGLALADAQDLGRRFEQNAIVWSGADATPQLVVLR